MNADERQAQIERYGKAYDELVEALERFPREMWQYRPAPDRWTIHEIVVHITDSEANSYVRCRRLIAEAGQTLLGYDESAWARALDYHAQSVDDALQLFRWLRHNSWQLIKDQPEAIWANTGQHTESGPMTLDDWLNVYARHVSDHVVQMALVHADWQNRSTT